uniref:Uncharacterized protein n=1 Tax=Oryza meridionalis TaxID=40149 RepID=A0A0E0E822_9ORYZ
MAVTIRRSSSRLLPLVRYGRRPLVRQKWSFGRGEGGKREHQQNGSHAGSGRGARDTVGVTLDEFLGGKGLMCREVALASWTDVNADDPDMCPVLHRNEHRRAQA